MPLDILDPRVRIIVTLRKNGHPDDEVTSFMSLFDTVAKTDQERLSEIVNAEDPEIVRALVTVLPDVHASVLKKGSKSPRELIEQAAQKFFP